MVEKLPVPVSITRLDNHEILYVNPKGYEIYEMVPNNYDFIGKKFQIIILIRKNGLGWLMKLKAVDFWSLLKENSPVLTGPIFGECTHPS